jgi:thiosulfate/3-mercaptopyruvate sulfurtransferase
MRRTRLLTITMIMLTLIVPMLASARTIEPVVSTDWLEKNLFEPNIVILDVRKVEEFNSGHILNSVNVFYGAWAIKRKALLNELPASYDFPDLLGLAGINKDSKVIVIGKMDTPSDRADAPRVVWTLKYMGVGDVALLDGGYNKWMAEKRPTALATLDIKMVPYQGAIQAKLFVDKKYVLGKLGNALIVDGREPEFYRGEKKLPFVEKAGRIKGAVNLPSSLLYKADFTYKSKDELAAAASPVVGTDKGKEIILYCDTGKICTAWAFLLSDVLGYSDVKLYDGSSQEWMADPSAPVEP